MGREITLNKENLIEKIKDNKAAHIADYHEGIKSYKVEAKKQLEKQLKELADGSISVRIDLITPVNKSDEYDKVLSMFEWEESDSVVLSESEFKHYVLDEAPFAINAKFLNSSYR
jgi:hypothetical protein